MPAGADFYPEVTTDYMFVDNAAMKMIQDGFLSKLKYKAERSGKFFIQTDTFFPSSKTCPRCRYKFDGLTLAMRQWICPKCGGLNLRDYAAAINIKREGIVQLKAAGLAVLRR